VVRLKTLVGKIVCTVLSVSGSMTLGPEGKGTTGAYSPPSLTPLFLCFSSDRSVWWNHRCRSVSGQGEWRELSCVEWPLCQIVVTILA
jgi:hypothetical protein